ncbi:MAG: CHAT domain-containing protein [Gammaproteobacteria bacterium]|nr:CHAT domain-containing protein [Gammaproteobacteria bacterium]
MDPTWNNEELANITTLEIALVANPIALAACAADADSSITGIPFAALHDGTNYLVESYATSYLHGASEKPPKIHWPAQVFAGGDPSRMGNQNTPGGLIDALMNLGTRQVVGTLWLIDDHDAFELMRRFYD